MEWNKEVLFGNSSSNFAIIAKAQEQNIIHPIWTLQREIYHLFRNLTQFLCTCPSCSWIWQRTCQQDGVYWLPHTHMFLYWEGSQMPLSLLLNSICQMYAIRSFPRNNYLCTDGGKSPKFRTIKIIIRYSAKRQWLNCWMGQALRRANL